MPIPKAKTAHSITSENKLKLKKDRDSLKRKDHKILKDYELKYWLLNEQKKRERAYKISITKQKNSLINQMIQTAASGSYLISIDELDKNILTAIEDEGFKPSLVADDLLILKSGLFDYWKVNSLAEADNESLLEPLHKFLIKAIGCDPGSKLKELSSLKKIVSTILYKYDNDLKNNDLDSLKSSLERLQSFNSDDIHSEIQIYNLFPDRLDYVRAKKLIDKSIIEQYIDFRFEKEFFSIIWLILYELSNKEDTFELIEFYKEQSPKISLSIKDMLSKLPANSYTIGWWHSFTFNTVPPKNLSEELYKLASYDGQLLINDIAKSIEVMSNKGESSVEIEIEVSDTSVFLKNTVRKYLEILGYSVEEKIINDVSSFFVVSW